MHVQRRCGAPNGRGVSSSLRQQYLVAAAFGEWTRVQVCTEVQTPGAIGLCYFLFCDGNQGKNQKGHSCLSCSRQKVFVQHEISRLFNALVVSVLLYNAETWVPTRVQVRTHFLPQMPTKNGKIPQSARSRQGTSLRRGSVERDADAECLFSPRVSAVAHWTVFSASCLRTMSTPISGHLSCYVIYLSFPPANLEGVHCISRTRSE